jgi:DNA-binding NarL/FixJ family response regulator
MFWKDRAAREGWARAFQPESACRLWRCAANCDTTVLRVVGGEKGAAMAKERRSRRSTDALSDATPAAGAATEARPRVLVISDVRLYRDGLVQSLSRHLGDAVLGGADASAASLAEAVALAPDAIILDIANGGLNTAKMLALQLPSAKIVAFAVRELDEDVLACAEVGIAGFVPSEGNEEDLIAALNHALRGELRCSPRLAGALFRRLGTLAMQRPPAAIYGLTRRERQILDHLEQGMSNKEIARALRIGHATVKNHVHSILEKLQVRRRGEAAARLRGFAAARGG